MNNPLVKKYAGYNCTDGSGKRVLIGDSSAGIAYAIDNNYVMVMLSQMTGIQPGESVAAVAGKVMQAIGALDRPATESVVILECEKASLELRMSAQWIRGEDAMADRAAVMTLRNMRRRARGLEHMRYVLKNSLLTKQGEVSEEVYWEATTILFQLGYWLDGEADAEADEVDALLFDLEVR